ncbi:MORC family CW-type zinc finger protein 2A, partial [Ophiophagus hannah]
MIGRYGNGLKSGSMRIGNDLILFTKKENTITCLLFSQTFCETEGLNELMNQFNAIYGKTGTLLVIYNLKLALNGEPELDILTDEKDILTDRMPENYPEEKSLRAYTAILYLNPRMRIFIQAEKVRTKHLLFCFYGPSFGAGAVGIIDVPLDIMEPTHNKQAFANIKEYRHLLKSMENYLIQYWKDMGISQKGEKFWNDFGYLSDKWCERPSETVQYKRRRAAEIPYIVQCDVCLKWRLLSLNTDINNEVHDIWNCGRSPNSLENKCSIPENLPRIPLGTLNPTHYLNDKEKLLIDSIQRNKRKVEN